MVTDRHESEDVTPVPSRVMKVRVSTLAADSREPGCSDICTLQVQQGQKLLSFVCQHLHIHLLKSLRLQSRQACLYLSVEAA